ncbi:MAG: biotin--[acetyl-CoA-carboxylase] ligase [Myxococcales bacterium]|nr:biotin--[acetyl-CoA-carboxylase] ligase [Myxococcales bacterium]
MTGELSPERVTALLDTRWLGRSLRCLASVTSTSDVARADGRAGAPHGHVVLAEFQTSGRGRRGRVWLAPPGQNLALSMLLRPSLPIDMAPTLTLIAALACRDTLAEWGVTASIKWPNDLLIDGRKVAGILSEMGLANGKLDQVIIGIGLNVNLDPRALPEPVSETATSLAAHLGQPLDRASLLACLLRHLEAAFDEMARGDVERLLDRYSRHSATLGQRVRVQLEGTPPFEGVAIGLTRRGALRVQHDSGEIRDILAGDVEKVRGVGGGQ